MSGEKKTYSPKNTDFAGDTAIAADYANHREEANHLGNVLAVVSDRKVAVEDQGNPGTVEYYEADIVSAQDYYPFGMIMPGRSVSVGEYRYGFNSMEQDDEWSVTSGHLDFGARIYDSRLGRWLAVDPAMAEYPDLSPYHFSGNSPIVFNDPDGKRFYFAAGAADDPENRYAEPMIQAMEAAGIQDGQRVSAHADGWSDIPFTVGENRHQPYDAPELFPRGQATEIRTGSPNWRILEATDQIKNDLIDQPLGDDEQLNLIGYSTGSVIMAQSALKLAEEGHQVDNLVLIGSPILEDSDLSEALESHDNIKNVIRDDIEGDNVQDGYWSMPSFLFKGDDHPHMEYTLEGEEGDKAREELGDELHQEGLR